MMVYILLVILSTSILCLNGQDVLYQDHDGIKITKMELDAATLQYTEQAEIDHYNVKSTVDSVTNESTTTSSNSSEEVLNITSSIHNNIPPIFVLNLDRSLSRWKDAMEEMKSAGLSVNRLSAVDGRKLTTEELRIESTRFATFLQPRGVIGCYLSHKKFWQIVVDNGYESAIVFEDDVHLVKGFRDALSTNLHQLAQEPNNTYDVILLGAIGRVRPDGKDGISTKLFSLYMGGNRPLKRITDSLIQPPRPAGTHAYMVSNAGARKLLSLCKKATFHVDLDAWRHRSLVIRMFDPMLAFQTFESTSLTELNEREKSEARKFFSNAIQKSPIGVGWRVFTEYMREPYTGQTWEHVMVSVVAHKSSYIFQCIYMTFFAG